MSVALSIFLSYVEEIASEQPAYRLGGKAEDDTCDCIGLIIGALRRAGFRWPGVHGSNWAARTALRTLLPVTSASELCLGDLVFKARKPGANRYALPERYRKDPDRNDYYHVGVVTRIQPLEITHCTSPGGIKRDSSLGAWCYRGSLSAVEPVGESAEQTEVCNSPKPTDTPQTGKQTIVCISTPDGNPLKVRAKPSRNCPLYWKVPNRTEGVVLGARDDAPGWARVRFGGVQGWAMTVYLKGITEED